MLAQCQLKPECRMPGAGFVADILVFADLLEAKRSMQALALLVRDRESGEDIVISLQPQKIEERSVEYLTGAFTMEGSIQINRRFCRPLVGCAIAEVAGIGIANNRIA